MYTSVGVGAAGWHMFDELPGERTGDLVGVWSESIEPSTNLYFSHQGRQQSPPVGDEECLKMIHGAGFKSAFGEFIMVYL